jgi:hypothetical protein
MRTDIAFPIELLNAPVGTRIEYFDHRFIPHRNIMAVIDEILRRLNKHRKPSTIILYGPTGVGKSTARKFIINRIMERYAAEMSINKSLIPIACVSAVTPLHPGFDWKDFLIRSLLTLQEPLVNKKIDLNAPDREPSEYKGYSTLTREGASALRRSFENALIHRGTRSFIIDNAHAIGVISSGRTLLRQLEAIRDLMELTEKIMMLIGTYDLKDFLNNNGQTARRSVYIHFPRYIADDKKIDDLIEFMGVVKSFEQIIPIKEIIDLLAVWEYLYAGCAGLIGVLKDWLLDALSLALEEGSDILTMDHLIKTALTEGQIKKILLESIEGENVITDSSKSHPKLFSFANLEGLLHLPNTDIQNKPSKPLKPEKKGNKKPGVRNPTRDLVGIEHALHGDVKQSITL